MDVAIVSVIVTGATAVASMISGIIINKMNNKHQLKAKKYELLNNGKIIAFKEYIAVINEFAYVNIKSDDEIFDTDKFATWHEEYFKKYSIILLYANKKLKESIISFNELVNRCLNDLNDIGKYLNITDMATPDAIMEYKQRVTNYSLLIDEYQRKIIDLSNILSDDINNVKS